MYIEIINKICDLLKIKHQINFDNPPFNIILYIHCETDFSIDDDLNEFTPLYNKKNFLHLGKDIEVNDKNYSKFMNNDKINVNNVSNIFSFKSVSCITNNNNNNKENSFNKENKFKRKIKNKNLLRSLIKNTENIYESFYSNIINPRIMNNNNNDFFLNKNSFLNQPKNLLNQFYESKSFKMKERNDFLSKNSLYSIKNKNNNNENNNNNNENNNENNDENNNNDNIIVINNENNNSNKNLNNKNICNIILKESKDSYECFSDEEDEEDDESNKLGNNKSFRLTYINKNINNNNNNNINNSNNNINNSNNKNNNNIINNNNNIINNNNNKNKEIIDNLNKINTNSNSTFYSSKDTNQFKNNLSSLPTYRERKSDNDVIKNTPLTFNQNNKINKNNTYKTLEIHKNNFIDELKIFQQGKNITKKISDNQTSHKSNNSISITNTISNKLNIISNLSENTSLSQENEKIDVLIVDDEQFNLNALSKNLKKLGILCDKSMNGAECINLIKEKKKKNIYYKLILMDIIMPVLGGIDASKKIQEMVNNKIINSDVNIVFLSASVDQKLIILELKKNYPIIKEFLLKPVKFTKIEEIVKKFYKKSF